MIDRLRRSLLYTEKRVRDFIFQAAEDLLAGRSPAAPAPMIVSRLAREAARRARETAEQAGFEFKNWDIAGNAVLRAMLNAGVLLTHGRTVIPAGITGQATEVVALAECYREATEAYLLEFLIRDLGDVSTRDHTALAHALFRQFDTSIPLHDLEDRVVRLLASLAGRLVLTEGGVYSIVETGSPGTP